MLEVVSVTYIFGFITGVSLSALCVICARNDRLIKEQSARISRVESQLHMESIRSELEADLSAMFGGAE